MKRKSWPTKFLKIDKQAAIGADGNEDTQQCQQPQAEDNETQPQPQGPVIIEDDEAQPQHVNDMRYRMIIEDDNDTQQRSQDSETLLSYISKSKLINEFRCRPLGPRLSFGHSAILSAMLSAFSAHALATPLHRIPCFRSLVLVGRPLFRQKVFRR